MLSAHDNETLTRVGPGTVMGDLFRQYWLPAVRSDELPAPDPSAGSGQASPPVRIRILGENLIAFRASSGAVGLVADACPHRGASLFFGRNEEDGLRCVYHGWKFDVTGACVDMPSEPAESNPSPGSGQSFKTKVRAKAYPCVERNGTVWTYMGPRETPPPLPVVEANLEAHPDALTETTLRECSWLQALEGDIDTSHVGFLHNGSMQPDDLKRGSYLYYTVTDRAPRFAIVDTPFGVSYGAYRPAEPGTSYWRIGHFMFPAFTMVPTGILGTQLLGRYWVPMDDHHVMHWSWSVPSAGSMAGRAAANFGAASYLPNGTGWYERWRPVQDPRNDYQIDREAQRTTSFTGIDGVSTQDQAITESMGPVCDRTNEHLGTSDAMVIRTRRALLRAARALREHGTTPLGVDEPEAYLTRSGGVILPDGVDWLAATSHLREAFTTHEGLTEAPLCVRA
jgi:phenylpropionate dioxygenase-like ring-hydroxylating dioxygenase large terminal subunit